MKKIIILIGLAVMCCFGLGAGTASAHVLKVDGDISAELHIEPDDNPVSSTPVTYILYFDDTSDRFSLASCDCAVAIQQNGHTIASQSLNDTHPLQSNNTFTFPRQGSYTLRVSGQPKKAGAFQPFTLTYPEQVAASGGADVQPFPRILAVGLGVGMALILLGAYKQNYDFTKKTKK